MSILADLARAAGAARHRGLEDAVGLALLAVAVAALLGLGAPG